MRAVYPRWDDRDVTRWWWNSNVYNDKGGEPMSEKKVTRAEVMVAMDLERNLFETQPAGYYRDRVLDRLFPKSEYEKALAGMSSMGVNCPEYRHIWNAAIEACVNLTYGTANCDKISKLKVPK